MLFDKKQVFYHAHMIKSTVPFIECFETTTWKITTLIAEADKSFTQQVAMFAHVCAVLAARSAACTIHSMVSLLIQVVLHCQVASTYTAVHPARSNEFFKHIL